jgi:hypothetical protein
MAENRRIRLEGDIESWLLTHAERVLGKPSEHLTAGDYSTLVNRILYEFKLLTRPTGLSTSMIPMVAAEGQGRGRIPSPASAIREDYSFDAQLGDLFEQEAA